MSNPLVRRLEQFTRLSAEDRSALDRATGNGARQVAARTDIIREGDRPNGTNLVLSGWACRYKQLEDGRRQILGFLLPGDLCDYQASLLREMDHSIGALTPVTVTSLPRTTLDDLTACHPRVGQALWWETLVAHAIHREWIVSLGQRDAAERIGHLLCELLLRLRSVGLTRGDTCDIPLTQADLGDAMGLSTVHVNRTLQYLRGAGLITLKGGVLTIPDLCALMDASLFNPTYLHLHREGAQFDANE
ncbi:Crp/Fnr family transcriptional regulator [Roseomonas sp. CCTCC AB2023176]|uniref:Crp/Fnr family transcriptional regulator n=1 Tax=Roseomonas sp. CCTCC AB2023176 TaxID=3342640 RepID=UPI0035D6B844